MWTWDCRACALLLLVSGEVLGAGGRAAVYADFRVQAFAPSIITNESFSGKSADPDGDGLVNFLEHALGLDPTRGDACRRFDWYHDSVAIGFRFRAASAPVDAWLEVRGASELSGDQWHPLTTTVQDAGASG